MTLKVFSLLLHNSFIINYLYCFSFPLALLSILVLRSLSAYSYFLFYYYSAFSVPFSFTFQVCSLHVFASFAMPPFCPICLPAPFSACSSPPLPRYSLPVIKKTCPDLGRSHCPLLTPFAVLMPFSAPQPHAFSEP